jgi:hypothetical protein
VAGDADDLIIRVGHLTLLIGRTARNNYGPSLRADKREAALTIPASWRLENHADFLHTFLPSFCSLLSHGCLPSRMLGCGRGELATRINNNASFSTFSISDSWDRSSSKNGSQHVAGIDLELSQFYIHSLAIDFFLLDLAFYEVYCGV